jgi:probable O-glycosylation ligase (exosortase A-associated)
MRDLLVAGFVLLMLPVCFRRPFIGLLVFSLLAYMRVQDLTWGWARHERWSYYVALVTGLGFLVSGQRQRFMLPDLRCWIMVALVVLVGASLLHSEQLGTGDLENYLEYVKVVGVALFTTGVVKNREYLRILVYVIALCFGFFGVKSGLAFVLSGFRMEIIQGPGGMLVDRNDFGLALCMALPMLLHLGLAERRPLLRRVMLATVPLTALTIVSTYSRGAFLALVATVLVLVWRSRNRVAGFALVLVLGLAGWLAAPASYLQRLSTIGSPTEEGSARGRIEAWKVAGNMISANPILGVGYGKFQRNYKAYDANPLTDPSADPEERGTRVAHNSYLQIWAECGTPAYLLYMTLFVLTLRELWQVRREAERRYRSSWILSYAAMFEASLVAFVVGATFLNRAHFDLFYHWVSIVLVFGVIARREMDEELHFPTKAQGGRGELEAIAPAGFARRVRASGYRDALPAHGTS